MLQALLLTLTLFALSSSLLSSAAHAQSITVPVDSTGSVPASDLIYDDQPIDENTAAELQAKGVDLSTLPPVPTDVWQNTSYSAVDEQGVPYPAEGAEVRYDTNPGSFQGVLRGRVLYQPSAQMPPIAFQLVMSSDTHAALARAALLRKLGYPIPTPRHYRKLKVRFASISDRTIFLDQLSDATRSARGRWIAEMPENDPYVVLMDLVLERSQIDIPTYQWGIVGSEHLRGRRSVRALILPLSLLNIEESVNIYSWDFGGERGALVNNAVVIYQKYAPNFLEVTYDDLRWMARRIGKLTRAELREIIGAGKYPDDIAELLFQKTLSRRNHMLEMFDVAREFPRKAPRFLTPDGQTVDTSENFATRKYDFNTKISIGNVKKGRLTVAKYDGYPMEFAYEMPESPLRAGQVWRYLSIDMIGNAIGGILEQLNGRFLTFASPNTALRHHQQELIRRMLEHQQNNPGVPYQQNVAAWAGPIGGFGVNASRDVVTGTYYGNESKVQLVDSIGVRASIGLFVGFDGVASRTGGVTPSAQGNVSVIRNYVRVRPIADMQAALEENWAETFVPGFTNRLANVLRYGPEADPEDLTQQLKKFFLELAPNEMFMVTDTLAVGGHVQASIPIPILVGPNMYMYNPTVGARISSQPQMLRRTTFVRTENGVQVYLQDAKVANLDVEMSVNWLVNILTVGQGRKNGDSDAEAYLLDTARILEENKPDEIRALTVGLRSLLRFQQVAPLREKFGHYQIDHDMSTRVRRAKILPFVFRQLKEEHRVKISPPGFPEGHERTLFSQKIVNTRGTDVWSLVADIGRVLGGSLPMLTRQNSPGTAIGGQAIGTIFGGMAGSSGPNPANSFLGKGYWSVYRSEAEVTPSRPTPPITFIEHNWGGWLLKKKKLLKILNRIQKEVVSLNLDRPLAREEAFAAAEQLQMYQIGSSFAVYQKGVKKIFDDLVKPISPETVVENLVKVEGQADLDEFCAKARRRNRHVQREAGHRFRFACLKPWMERALELRKDVLREGLPTSAEGEVRFANFLMRKLENKLEQDVLMKWLGKENFFFQIRVSGFRTKDENGDREYISDSVGTQASEADLGAFRDFISDTGLSANEIYGGYLSEGY